MICFGQKNKQEKTMKFEVHEALQKANESINKLGLMPVSL